MFDFIDYKRIPSLDPVDILVIGAGSAGCIASLAAKYTGAYDVMLVERYGFPGGTSTQMLDTFYGFFTPGEVPKKVVSGIPDLIVNELDKTGDMFLRPNTYGAGTGVNYNPERLKLIWDQKIIHAGIRYLLHTMLVDVVRQGDELTTCVFYNKSGFFKINAKRVIDASGDADFCHLAGFSYEIAGELEPAQSMTTTFRMSNVDLKRYKEAGGKTMLYEKMEKAVDSGKHPLPRRKGSAHEMVQPMCVSTVAVKVGNISALKTEELTKAEIEGRRQAFVYERFFREEVPGYEDSKIIGMSHQIGVRETRRVYGLKRLTWEDCLSGNMPEDRIFLCGAPIEDHREGQAGEPETVWHYIPDGGVYGVPYGVLVPRNSSTSWAVGRCFSATHDAHASCRSMAQTMSMGQAAGISAVISLNGDCAAPDIHIRELQDKLMELGAILEYPEKEADISRGGWCNNRSNI